MAGNWNILSGGKTTINGREVKGAEAFVWSVGALFVVGAGFLGAAIALLAPFVFLGWLIVQAVNNG